MNIVPSIFCVLEHCSTWTLDLLFCFVKVVEKSDLLGLDYIWEICLNTPDEAIADKAIQLLLCVSYTNLAVRLKRVSHSSRRTCMHVAFVAKVSILSFDLPWSIEKNRFVILIFIAFQNQTHFIKENCFHRRIIPKLTLLWNTWCHN